MIENKFLYAGEIPTRRRMIVGAAIAIGGLTTGWDAWGKAQQPTMKETPSAAANLKRTSLHQENVFNASGHRIYELLLTAEQFAACTGVPAEIDSKAGGAFSLFGGLIVGRNVELIPEKRIVQAWRPTSWEPGVYSMVRFEMKPRGSETVVILDHTGFPEGDYDQLFEGWNSHYWVTLKKYIG